MVETEGPLLWLLLWLVAPLQPQVEQPPLLVAQADGSALQARVVLGRRRPLCDAMAHSQVAQ